MMQLISVVENVYFSDWKERESIQQLARRAERHRNPDSTRVLEYMSEDTENHSLLHLFEHTPNLKLNLSFLTMEPSQNNFSKFTLLLYDIYAREPHGLHGNTWLSW